MQIKRRHWSLLIFTLFLAVTLPLSVQPIQAQGQLCLDSNTVALYHFNERDTVIDSSPYHHDGQLINAITLDSAVCNDSDVLLLGGSFSYVTMPISSALKFTGDFTLEAVVRLRDPSASMPSSTNEDIIISTLCRQQVGGYQMSFYRLSNDSIAVYVDIRNGPGYRLWRPVFYSADHPGCMHVAVVFRKIDSGSRTEVKVFIDSAFVQPDTTDFQIAYSGVDSMLIGVNTTDYGVPRGFDGVIGEVRISNVARTLDDLRFSGDADGDGICNAYDNCAAVYNPGQEDYDHDSIGDACDPCNSFHPVVTVSAVDTLVRFHTSYGYYPTVSDADGGQFTISYLQYPHWCRVRNDSIVGFAPDTAFAELIRVEIRDTCNIDTVSVPVTVYLCGNANGDATVDISDAVYLIAYIFSGGSAPSPLLAGDANCDSTVDISDVVYLIAYIFSGGSAPCKEC